ncbi:MAG: Uncharacterized protein FD147_990 [Chloroflexi bacterium]|nr:MAG: Uncharacterized protein FD147_990 [Chloroflexota bacterium]MBA4375404.1 hypothetical protein [Anaerolinea sp.]
MITNRILKWLPGLIMILSLAACNIPLGKVTAPDLQATVAAEVAIAQSAMTIVAATLNAGAQIIPTNTVAVEPLVTFTPTLTPTITLSPTPEGVFLTLSKDTNCRKGPLAVFQAVTTVKAGQTVEVVGRNPENDTYYVKNPNSPGSFCWLWGQFATLTGNQVSLPVFTPQPTPTATYTPTPTANFSVTYNSLTGCGPDFAFKIYVKNTGSTIWQSIRVSGNDSTTGVAFLHTSNTFKEYAGCVVGITQEDLTPGEDSFVVTANPGHLNYNPAGHSISVTVTLCSEQNGAGTCMSKSLNFVP